MSETVILCDLGGVLIDLNWREKAVKLFGNNASDEKLKRKWAGLKSVGRFESGRISFDEFYREFSNETGTNLDFNRFAHEFTTIVGDLKPGCMEMLDDLSRHYILAMLSNTNMVHVEHLRNKTRVFEPFKHLFFSYELGLIKPDPKIFEVVCSKLQKKPENILFFDDSQINIKAAVKTGLKAHLASSPQQIRKIIESG
jgi:putative hydrolase of the HAD superfamily